MQRPSYVFAYGSLMWSPEIRETRHAHATLIGFHRAPCLLSIEHRGTRQKPGVVFGLDEGGICDGIAQSLPDETYCETLDQIDERELVTGAYERRALPIRLATGEEAEAWAYVMRRDHPQYVSNQTRDHLLHLIRQGHGGRGPCEDYIRQTWQCLVDLGIRDEKLAQLVGWLNETEHSHAAPPVS